MRTSDAGSNLILLHLVCSAGTPDEDNWPKFKELPGAKNVRYKKRTCQLRDKFPKVSYTGGASLSEAGYEMLLGLLRYDPDNRMTAREALGFDSWFQEEPKSLKPEDMPTWPSQHEKPKDHKKRARSPTEMADFDDDDKRFNRLAV
jgi:cell division cycle 2-like protein